MQNKHDIEEIISHFHIYGSYQESQPMRSGHINDTYVVIFGQAGTRVRYILQRINHHVFRNPEAVMENICRVTLHAARHLQELKVHDASRRALTIIPTHDGKMFRMDADGNCWRCYLFIEGARSYAAVEEEWQAFEAGKAFGNFQHLAASLQGPRLHETIPNFHHTRSRFDRLREAVEADVQGRLREVRAEWDFVRSREPLVDVLLDLQKKGDIPERITHNDTKLNNVLIDDSLQTGICVIDLDTVMNGLVHYDFGDLVRTSTSPAAEDETDVSKVHMRMGMFEALVRGYLSTAKGFLNEAEIEYLAFAGKLITLETGIRFLTDYLKGDVYFKIARPEHNLDRCRTQWALVRSIEEQEDAMQKLVRQVASSGA